MREEKNVRIKNDGSQIFRLPVKKISGFLGSVMFLSCLAFPLPTFAERMSQDETILEKEISSEEEALSAEKISQTEETKLEEEKAFAEETLFTEEAASGNKKSEEKETLIYESPIFTDGGEAFIPEETRSEGEKGISVGIKTNQKCEKKPEK